MRKTQIATLQYKVKALCIIVGLLCLAGLLDSVILYKQQHQPVSVEQATPFYEMAHAVVMLRVEGQRPHPFFPIDENGNPNYIDAMWCGTGVLVDDLGTIITANHVVKNATCITVIDHDGNEYQTEAEDYHGTDFTDIGIVRMSPQPLVSVSLAIVPAKVGDTIFSCGTYTGGLMNSLSRGVVGHMARMIPELGYDKPVFQTDASAAPGSSGCPIYNEDGQIVGILVSGVDTGCCFAVPIDQVREVYDWYTAYGNLEEL